VESVGYRGGEVDLAVFRVAPFTMLKDKKRDLHMILNLGRCSRLYKLPYLLGGIIPGRYKKKKREKSRVGRSITQAMYHGLYWPTIVPIFCFKVIRGI
jgi:hypothetical protein